MKLTDNEYELLSKKLEYRFKNSGNELVDKIINKKDLSKEDITLLLKKLEYTFRKSGNEILDKLTKIADLEVVSYINYSSIKAKQKRDLKHLESFDKYFNRI